MPTYHTIIIGAGASGLFCAGSFNAPKIILEHNKVPGVKVGVSGGGKCNFSNRIITAADYVSTRKHFCKSALSAFTPRHFTALLEQHHIEYEERTNGQLFAKNARDIVRFLVNRAKAAHTDFALNTQALDVLKTDDGFTVHTSAGTLQARHLVLATGGLSYPDLGASSWAIQLARKWALPIVEQRPALCSLLFPKELRDICPLLAGNSTRATVKTGKHSFTDQLLFTHQGISGPAVLPISLYWNEQNPVTVNFLPGTDLPQLLAVHKQSNQKLSAFIPLPGHMAQTLLGPLDQPLANISKGILRAALERLSAFTFIPPKTAGYTKAEVTRGGIDTQALSPVTFEVKQIPGLYIIGELLDVTGRLGGFNLHWAWASAMAAATHLSQKI